MKITYVVLGVAVFLALTPLFPFFFSSCAASNKEVVVTEQATLPPGMGAVDHSIAIMKDGQSGWTVSWAMYHDKERKLWLNGSYTVDKSGPFGTRCMFIRRDKAGWHVDAKLCDDPQWSEAGYATDFIPVPVTSLKL